MNIARSRALKAIALALASVLQVYAGGGFALAAAEASGVPKPAARQGSVQGRLTATGDNPVSVNGNNARTGETIFSGQRITTPAGTQATVNLPGLGTLDISRSSDVTLTFGEGRIAVVVLSGCVELKTEKGVTGTVESKGRTQTTDPQKRDEIDTCDDGGAPPLNGPAASATAGGLGSGTATALTAGIVGAFALIAHEFISDSKNLEPAPCTPIPGTTSPLTPPSGCAP